MPRDTHVTNQNNNGLQFVSVETPWKSRATPRHIRRQVRSHVTRLQHRRARERPTRLREGPTTSLRTGVKLSTGRAEVVSGVDGGRQGAAAGTDQLVEAPSCMPRSEALVQRPEENATAADEPISESSNGRRTTHEIPVERTLSRSKSSDAFSQPILSLRTSALDDSFDIVGESLDKLVLNTSSVLVRICVMPSVYEERILTHSSEQALYKLIVQIQSRDFEDQYGIQPHTVGERYYSFVFTDPVLLTIVLLMTVRYRLETQGGLVHKSDMVQVLKLEDFVVRRINTALRDSTHALTDTMIVTILLCAGYEVKYGDPQVYHIHMNGLIRMINMRGGLHALEDPYLARMLIWHDINTAKILGHDGYLIHMRSSLTFGESYPASNVSTFRTPLESSTGNED